MPDRSRVARGRWGEARAAQWYLGAGYVVLDRNWRCPIGELDLVVGRAGVVVFVEVKARANDRFGPPAAAVGFAKQRWLRQLAVAWLDARSTRVPLEIRFDVVSITGVHVEVIEAAF